jgi:hypothetical protein
MFQNRQQRNPVESSGPKKYKHYIHSPFTLEHGGVKVSVDENGKAVIVQEHEDGEFDEIVTSASLFNRVIRMLQATRKVVYRDEPFRGEDEGDQE